MKLRVLIIAILLIASPIFAATQTSVLLSAISNPTPADIQVMGSPDFNLGNIVPRYAWEDEYPTPNSRPNSAEDPWLIAPAIRVPLQIRNAGAWNLYIYTDHKNSDYLQNNPEVLDRINQYNIPINGLINVENITSANTYKTVVPMIAWCDYNEYGDVTTDPNADWVFVTDTLVDRKYKLLPGTYALGTFAYEQRNVYIRTCWDETKLSGTYQANIIFLMDYE